MDRLQGLNRGLLSLVFLSFGIGLSLAGCSDFFSGTKTAPEPVKVAVSGECLGQMTEEMRRWTINGNGSPEFALDCLDATIDKFTVYTDGKRKDSWTVEEVANVFRQYLKAVAEPDRFVEDLFLFKPVVVGGSGKSITRQEFLDLREALRSFRPHVAALKLHHPILFLEENKLQTTDWSARVETSRSNLKELAAKLAARARSQNSAKAEIRPIQVRDLARLLNRFGIQRGLAGPGVPLAEVAKGLLVGGRDDLILPAEWPEFLERSFAAYSLALQVKGLLVETASPVEDTFAQVEEFLNSSVRLVKGAVASQSGKQIETKRIAKFISMMSELGWLRLTFQTESLNRFLPSLTGHWLYGLSKKDVDQHSTAIEDVHVEAAAQAVADYIEGQKFVRLLFDSGARTHADLGTAIKKMNLQDAPRHQIQQFSDLFGSGRPLVLDANGRLIVKIDNSATTYQMKDLSRINLARTVTSLIFSGYSSEAARSASLQGINEKETQLVYSDFRELGVDIGLMDPRINNSGARSFMEANLFMSISRSDALMSLHEAIEWFHFVLTGWRVADEIYEIASDKVECGTNETNVAGKAKVRASCFRGFLERRFAQDLSHLPGMVGAFQKMNPEERKEFFKALETVYRGRGYTEELIDSSEVRGLPPILAYAESIHTRFDRNGNDLLDEPEVWEALPHLKPMIQKESGLSWSWTTETAYSFLVKYGAKPGIIDMLGWSIARYFVSEQAHRMNILNIMAAFAESTRQKKKEDFTTTLRIYSVDNLKLQLRRGDATTVTSLQQHLQCNEIYLRELTRELQGNADQLVRGTIGWRGYVVDADHFINRLKEILDRNKYLSRSCIQL